MSKLQIVRAKIKRVNIEIVDSRLLCMITLETTCGGCRFEIELDNSDGGERLKKLFNILDIDNLNQIRECPCIAVFENYMFKDIGSFLWSNYEDLYSTSRKAPDYVNNIKKNWLYGYLLETDEPIVFE